MPYRVTIDQQGGYNVFVSAGVQTIYQTIVGAPVTVIQSGLDFPTRAAFVALIAAGDTVAAGLTVTAAGLKYLSTPGSTAISDIPGFNVGSDPAVGHFATPAEAYAWSVINNTPLLSSESGRPIYLLGEFLTPSRNVKFDNAAWRLLRTKSTTDNADHGIGVHLGITIAPGVHTADALGIAISGVAISNTPAATFRADAVGVRGGGVIAKDITNGRCWGGLFEVSLPPQSLVGGVQADGRMNGCEVGVYNYGGVEENDFDALTAKIGLIFATAAAETYARRNTAMIVAGNSFSGWYRGIVLRQVHTDYLYFTGPKAGATALNIVPSANWSPKLILLPNGKGIATFNTAGTSSALMLHGSDDGTVTELPLTTRIDSTTGEPLFILRRNQPAQTGAIARIRVDAENSAAASIIFGDISLTPTVNTAGAEQSQWTVRSRVAGSMVPQLTLGQGLVVGGATGGFQGTGTVSATGYHINGLAVLSARRTGWAVATGTATRTTFPTTTVTLEQLAERVKALIDDLLRATKEI